MAILLQQHDDNNTNALASILPSGYVLFIVGPGDGAMKHRIREFQDVREARECAEFFAAHWHDPRSAFEVWYHGQCVHRASPRAPHAPDDDTKNVGDAGTLY